MFCISGAFIQNTKMLRLLVVILFKKDNNYLEVSRCVPEPDGGQPFNHRQRGCFQRWGEIWKFNFFGDFITVAILHHGN